MLPFEMLSTSTKYEREYLKKNYMSGCFFVIRKLKKNLEN